MCVARFLVHFFSVHERDMKSFFKTLFGVKKKNTMIKLGCGPKDSTPVKFTYSFAVLSKLEWKQKSLKKSEFFLIVTSLLPARHQYL